MKSLVLSALVFFPALNLTAASFQEPVIIDMTVAQSRSDVTGPSEDSIVFDEWFADYDMYCKSLGEIQIGSAKTYNRTALLDKLNALIDENSGLTERLLLLNSMSKHETAARQKFFAQLRLEQALLTSKMSKVENSSREIASTETKKPSLLMSKATENRDAALRDLSMTR